MRDVCYCIDVQGNTTTSTSTSNFGSSGRVDGPLLETRSLLTCHQPRGSHILIWISVMNTLYVRCQTKDYILDIVAAHAGMRINRVNSRYISF